jgi:predicted chitinase
VKGQHGFPEDIKVWHVHPLGLVENFYTQESGDLICKDCGATITLTEEFLKHADVAPKASQAFIDELIKCSTEIFEKYGVNTCRQIKHLLAQAKHETLGFTAFREPLRYTTRRYTATSLYNERISTIEQGFIRKGISFSSHTDKIAWVEAHLMNNDAGYGEHCYGTSAQPGKDFRGRGMIHLTHYETYHKCAQAIGQPIDSQPELVETDPRIIIETALWFWKNNNIAAIANNHANDGDAGVANVTRPINSGLKGLADRRGSKGKFRPYLTNCMLLRSVGDNEVVFFLAVAACQWTRICWLSMQCYSRQAKLCST